MPGYSGTPLPKKLGIKKDLRVALIAVPADVRAELKDALSGCRIASRLAGPLDFVHLFTKSRVELEREMKRVRNVLAPAGMLWISWPKKASGVATDLTEDIIRDTGLALGLVDVKVCAVTEVWSGLKFVIPVKDRPKA
ncbi:MAG TPA: hypothetical protein VNW47_07580 [Terriglobales bacterium]|nr:hypothetical protein [Terriglobales bacterium]